MGAARPSSAGGLLHIENQVRRGVKVAGMIAHTPHKAVAGVAACRVLVGGAAL